MQDVTLDGIVISGEGNGKKFIALPWVKTQIEANVGFTPYHGTLNLQLTEASVAKKKQLEKAKTKIIRPAEGYCVGLLFKASLAQFGCAAIIPQVKGYPENIFELIAPVNLRKALKLSDGDAVSVCVYI